MKKRAKRPTPEDVIDAVAKLTGRTREDAEGLVRTAARSCYLCGGPTDLVGLFFPDDPQRYGAPAGKARLIIYGLCQTCRDAPGQMEAVEDKALRGLTRH